MRAKYIFIPMPCKQRVESARYVQKLGVDLLSSPVIKSMVSRGGRALHRPGVEIIPWWLAWSGNGLEIGNSSRTANCGFWVWVSRCRVSRARELRRSQELTGLARRDSLVWLFCPCPLSHPTGDRVHRLPHHLSFCVNIPHTPDLEPITGKTSSDNSTSTESVLVRGRLCSSGKLTPVRFCWRWAIVLLRHWAVFAHLWDATPRSRISIGRRWLLQQILTRLAPQLVGCSGFK